MLGSSETIAPGDVGLDTEAELPFEFRPAARASPLVISFPHVGLAWPKEMGSRPQVNFPRNADYAVDHLYVRAEALGAATVRARYSRLVVDLNRAGDDVSRELVPDHPAPRPRPPMSALIEEHGVRRPILNRGVVWRSAVGNIPLLSTLAYSDFAERIARYHRPYYAALECLLERRRQEFGYAILLDAHSMPGAVGRDLVLGTRSGTACDATLIDLARAALSGHHFKRSGTRAGAWPLGVSVDDPYRGGEIVANFGQPGTNVHALQLEISRALYLDEYRLELAAIPNARAVADRAAGEAWPQAAQNRDRRLLALVRAIDALVIALSRHLGHLASPIAAE